MTPEPDSFSAGKAGQHVAGTRSDAARDAVPAKSRLMGVDAARGLALLAMMAIHILPAVNDDLEPTLAWSLFAGRGVALFALLAGLSLALSSGGTRRLDGRSLTAARTGIAVRAGIIMVIGLLLGYLAIQAQVILAYYGVMFLLALPLLKLSVRALTWLAGSTALLMPFLMQGLRDYLPDPGEEQPTFTGLFTHFDVTAAQLLLTGVYPVLPWMAFICAGLAIGRLDLRSRRVQTGLLAGGCGLALLTTLASAFLLGPGGGLENLEEVRGGEETVNDILVWGPDPTLPTDSWWWLAGMAPYSSTPLAILNTIGISVAVLAALLLLGQRARPVISPLAAMGSMTLTLYTAHLLLLATGLLADSPEISLIVQVLLLSVFAVIWGRKRGQGPLERLVSAAVKRTRTAVLARGSSGPGSGPGRPAHGKHGARAENHPEHGHHRADARDPDPPPSGP
ncbi:heparan-alpha-glucosaminide N-acetyltransferase domain-containing protein [Arthrobacter luteolus]|uniref:heparan-alpha-glucosaminide N-acetyltransferase domain-containing protein n=1 Tax=Arthrobacter luteolus TaxID=98672 RepID=UPI0009F9BC8B|nr:heparan-alpha-glucosaminide N-acetyltransferase domain-containing protein [Arthrobacter luteolus]